MLNLEEDSSFDVDKLSYEIFSILETKFLFGYDSIPTTPLQESLKLKPITTNNNNNNNNSVGKVRVLSIDGGGATDGILAATALARLESFLRRKSGNPNARIAHFFDVVAGAGAGGILAALLFTRGKDGNPIFTADQALSFLIQNRRKLFRVSPESTLRRLLGRPAKLEKLFAKTFGESTTLKDTLKTVLIPCYDLSSDGPFVFSRADAVEFDGYDFKMKDVCAATSAVGPAEMKSVDGRTKILAVNGEVAMNNPTAAAITHVLHNKQEFPMCNGVEDLLVVSLGNGESQFDVANSIPNGTQLVRIAGDGASDMVDQAVSMAFGECRTSNYVRIQANESLAKKHGGLKKGMNSSSKSMDMLAVTENMLEQKNVESVLFQGKKMVETTNLEKLELFAGDLIKEQERRRTSILPTVTLKQSSPSPRTSSATTLSNSTLSSC
ncbi:patatin-like protein 7 [Quercus suber]|uniref:Patatin n=2 Tax=Quercus suber TaxID=58331 RepID=A0AAW0JQE1_QUESU